MNTNETAVFETPFNIKNRRKPSSLPLESENYRFIFVAGLHRSGTSIVHRLIREHPEVTGFRDTGSPEDEGQHLQTVYPVAKLFGGAGRFAFDPEAALTEESELITDEARRRLLCEWRPYLDESKSNIVEKSPPNLIRTRFLQALFPQSHFVFVYRHPLAVAMATRKWSKTTIIELVFHWMVAHQILVSDLPMLYRTIFVRYEDLVFDPDAVTQRIYSAIGLSESDVPEAVIDANKSYFDEIDPDSEEIRRISATLWESSIAERLGYQLAPPFFEAALGRVLSKEQFLDLLETR